MTCFFCGEGSKFDNQIKTITISVNTANKATVESADTVMSYFVSLICGERTGRIVRVPGFSAIDMTKLSGRRTGFQSTKRPNRQVYAAFYRIEGILTKNSTPSREKTFKGLRGQSRVVVDFARNSANARNSSDTPAKIDFMFTVFDSAPRRSVNHIAKLQFRPNGQRREEFLPVFSRQRPISSSRREQRILRLVAERPHDGSRGFQPTKFVPTVDPESRSDD